MIRNLLKLIKSRASKANKNDYVIGTENGEKTESTHLTFDDKVVCISESGAIDFPVGHSCDKCFLKAKEAYESCRASPAIKSIEIANIADGECCIDGYARITIRIPKKT